MVIAGLLRACRKLAGDVHQVHYVHQCGMASSQGVTWQQLATPLSE
jgi:hypothetical protein